MKQLRLKIQTLETILDRTHELKIKDESIKRLEEIVNEKSASILPLENEIEFSKNRGSVDAETVAANVHAQAAEPGKEVEKLNHELEVLNRKRDDLEVRVRLAEKRIEELNLKLENSQKTSDEKQNKITAINEKLKVVATNAEPYVQKISAKIVEVYEASMTVITPQVAKLQNVVDPHLQEAKRLSKPYIDQATTIAEPHLEKAQVVLQPYTNYAIHAYGKCKKTAETYRRQVMGKLGQYLERR